MLRLVLWQGLVGNVTEGATWSVTRAAFLAPTYLTLGIVNVQRRNHGKPVSRDRLKALMRQLPGDGWSDANLVHGHSVFGEHGWFERDGKLYCHDYADSYGDGVPLSEFLGRHRMNLCPILGHPTPDPGFTVVS